jgi:hypothetical protein
MQCWSRMSGNTEYTKKMIDNRINHDFWDNFVPNGRPIQPSNALSTREGFRHRTFNLSLSLHSLKKNIYQQWITIWRELCKMGKIVHEESSSPLRSKSLS